MSWLPALSGPRLLAQIIKELLSVLRDPKARLLLIAPPLMQLLIFSFAATLEVRNASIAVLNQDSGAWSKRLLADVAAAGFVGRTVTITQPAQLRTLIERREVLLAIQVPADFSRRLGRGESAPLQVIVDGRRANAGQVALGYVEAIAARLGASAQAGPEAVVAVRHWFNPNLIYRWFVVPGLAGILAMFVSLIVTALSIARERELGTFDQLLVSPTTPLEIVIAKTVPALLIGTTLGCVMVGAGVLGFGIPFTGSFVLLLACLALFILSVVGVGLMISAVSSTQQQAILGTFAVAVPMVLMSGFATPVENMPTVLQWLAEAIPLKHFLIILHGSFLKGMTAAQAWPHAWPMLLIAAVGLTVAARFVRSKLG
ncbi:MAG: ABC transporter permease [Hydrogenophaga sp.]|uniref:ABC transporter permease n=1 Tax=Hydrogenophaga sp. TaxID=1904254 RepID=UPI001D997646|nr:ABC transporter permease [Hydrogenophaga sp.]MBX3609607.1 ABC transporter permease [Hydrogenophaga sp.]